MDITAETLQGFLETALDNALASANTLRQQLRVYETAAQALFAGGSIGSVSKNSTSQSYRGPGLGSYTPVQIANSWRMLITLYQEKLNQTGLIYAQATAIPPNACLAWFLTKYPTYAADSDQAVYDFMYNELYPINEYQTDVTLLRLTPTMPGIGYPGVPYPVGW